jgi:hypothetical protein
LGDAPGGEGLPPRHPFETVRHPKSVKNRQSVEAELLREVQHKAAAFEDAYNRCGDCCMGTLQECLEPAARDYGDALHAFSNLILDGQ